MDSFALEKLSILESISLAKSELNKEFEVRFEEMMKQKNDMMELLDKDQERQILELKKKYALQDLKPFKDGDEFELMVLPRKVMFKSNRGKFLAADGESMYTVYEQLYSKLNMVFHPIFVENGIETMNATLKSEIYVYLKCANSNDYLCFFPAEIGILNSLSKPDRVALLKDNENVIYKNIITCIESDLNKRCRFRWISTLDNIYLLACNNSYVGAEEDTNKTIFICKEIRIGDTEKITVVADEYTEKLVQGWVSKEFSSDSD